MEIVRPLYKIEVGFMKLISARAVLSIRLKRLKPLGPPSLGAHKA